MIIILNTDSIKVKLYEAIISRGLRDCKKKIDKKRNAGYISSTRRIPPASFIVILF